MATFYEKVIGKPADMVDNESGFHGWQVGSANLSVLEHSEMGGKTKDPGRVMFNFETSQVKEEFERIKALGGAVISAPYEMGGGWIATLADPDAHAGAQDDGRHQRSLDSTRTTYRHHEQKVHHVLDGKCGIEAQHVDAQRPAQSGQARGQRTKFRLFPATCRP